MGKFRVEVTKIANQDIEKHKKSGNKISIKNIAKILVDLSENPYEVFGNPEPLKYEYSGLWSRRINQKDRIIYRVEEDIVTVYVVSALGHYSDK
ncbi:Txe/YoeB family addiction module toxin [Flavobacterium limnophilum]|uniref:Txe/YoeB family addiction module toxin n=1 Tax=Flavobacterium limnophilum TaxID=3003262 RepID=UPI0022ABC708|nr:Txe/YoeB family addiction module toxin [Flavobacterium limnophilum]